VWFGTQEHEQKTNRRGARSDMLKIGDIKMKNREVLAPMAGVCNLPSD